MGKLFSGVLRSYVVYHSGQVSPDIKDMNNNSHFLPPFTERSVSCSYWGVLSCPLSCLYNTLYEGSLKIYSNTSHDNRVLVSNTLKCFPALDGVRYIICWEIHIVKKVVIMVSSEGKNWSLRYREGGI